MTRGLDRLIVDAIAEAVTVTRVLCLAHDYLRAQDQRRQRSRQIALMLWELCDAPFLAADVKEVAHELYDLGFRIPCPAAPTKGNQ